MQDLRTGGERLERRQTGVLDQGGHRFQVGDEELDLRAQHRRHRHPPARQGRSLQEGCSRPLVERHHRQSLQVRQGQRYSQDHYLLENSSIYY